MLIIDTGGRGGGFLARKYTGFRHVDKQIFFGIIKKRSKENIATKELTLLLWCYFITFSIYLLYARSNFLLWRRGLWE